MIAKIYIYIYIAIFYHCISEVCRGFLNYQLNMEVSIHIDTEIKTHEKLE